MKATIDLTHAQTVASRMQQKARRTFLVDAATAIVGIMDQTTTLYSSMHGSNVMFVTTRLNDHTHKSCRMFSA